MFNSFKAALTESLDALDQTIPRATSPNPPTAAVRSASPASAAIARGPSPNTTTQSPSQLADSALSSLRQSFQARRASSELQRKASGNSERGVQTSIKEEALPAVAKKDEVEVGSGEGSGGPVGGSETGLGTAQLSKDGQGGEKIVTAGEVIDGELGEEKVAPTKPPIITIETDSTTSARLPEVEPVIVQVTSSSPPEPIPISTPSATVTEPIPSIIEPTPAPELDEPGPPPPPDAALPEPASSSEPTIESPQDTPAVEAPSSEMMASSSSPTNDSGVNGE